MREGEHENKKDRQGEMGRKRLITGSNEGERGRTLAEG